MASKKLKILKTMTDFKALKSRFEFYQHRVEQAMDTWLAKETTHPSNLHHAMRYATLEGGKRLRPILCYATAEALDIPLNQLDGVASAVEIIHSYSLVHDDLPAMDNDDLRRGKPSCHKEFDEATAILAGDALQALAFYIITHDKQLQAKAETRIRMIEMLANACGSRGMAGGQAIDLSSVGMSLDVAQLEDMHIHKTGALIRASIVLASLCSSSDSAQQTEKLDHFGKCIGLAFQIKDDILDEEGDTEKLGKNKGSDRAQNKPTYPSIVGLSEAKTRAKDLYQDAIDSLADFGEKAEFLRQIADYIVNRDE